MCVCEFVGGWGAGVICVCVLNLHVLKTLDFMS